MSDTGKIVALVKALAPVADQETVDSAVETYLDNHPEATTTVQDGSITEAKLASALAQKVNQVSSLSDEIDYVKTVTGMQTVDVPTKIDGLNLPANGTQYVSGANYETYYVPVVSGYTYVWTANKNTAHPSLRLSFSESVPANGVPATFVEEQVIYSTPIKFYYTPENNGYLCVSVWRNQTSADLMQVIGTKTGTIDSIEKAINNVVGTDDTSIYIGKTQRQITLTEPAIIARRLIYRLGDTSITTWPGGLAIYKNFVFIGYANGYLGVYNRTTGELIASGKYSPSDNSHNNTLFFDYSTMSGEFPLLYTSYCSNGVTYCYVYSLAINADTIVATQVQRIQYDGQYFTSADSVDWSYDTDNNCLIAVIGNNSGNDTILKFAKPKTYPAVVTLTDADVLSHATVTGLTTRQENTITGNTMLMLDGTSNGTLYAIDIGTGEIVNSFALSPLYTGEPEGITVYDGKVFINFNVRQHGISANLFELSF